MSNLSGNNAVPNFEGAPGEPIGPQDAVGYQSVLTELDQAITAASSVTDKPRTRHTFETATKAYSDGLYFLIGASSDASISRQARQRMIAKLAELDTKFRELGV